MRSRKSLVLVCLVLALFLLVTGSALALPSAPAPSSHAQTLDIASHVFVPPALSVTPLAKQTTYVYITNTGECYHRSYCRYLKYSKHKVTKSWAKSHGYRACKVCRP
jgi:hypothetical protein